MPSYEQLINALPAVREVRSLLKRARWRRYMNEYRKTERWQAYRQAWRARRKSKVVA